MAFSFFKLDIRCPKCLTRNARKRYCSERLAGSSSHSTRGCEEKEKEHFCMWCRICDFEWSISIEEGRK